MYLFWGRRTLWRCLRDIFDWFALQLPGKPIHSSGATDTVAVTMLFVPTGANACITYGISGLPRMTHFVRLGVEAAEG